MTLQDARQQNNRQAISRLGLALIKSRNDCAAVAPAKAPPQIVHGSCTNCKRGFHATRRADWLPLMRADLKGTDRLKTDVHHAPAGTRHITCTECGTANSLE